MQLIEKIVRWVMVIMKTMISKAKKLLNILEEIKKPEETEEEKKARIKKQRKKFNPYPVKAKPKTEAMDYQAPKEVITREAPAKPKSSVIKGRAPAVIDMENETEKKKYEKILALPASEQVCGEKGTAYVSLNVASETAKILTRIDKKDKYPKFFLREMNCYTIVSDYK